MILQSLRRRCARAASSAALGAGRGYAKRGGALKRAAEEQREGEAKQAALAAAMAQLEASFGTGAVMRLGDRTSQDIDVVSTGSLLLDKALGIGTCPSRPRAATVWHATGSPGGRVSQVHPERVCLQSGGASVAAAARCSRKWRGGGWVGQCSRVGRWAPQHCPAARG